MAQQHQAKILATCETCRERKVRCNKRRQDDAVCINCQRRGNLCVFRNMRQRRPLATTAKEDDSTSGIAVSVTETVRSSASYIPGISSPSPKPPASVCYEDVGTSEARGSHPVLLIDRILSQGYVPSEARQSVVMASNDCVPSSTLAFFSEDKIKSLSHQLGHDRIHDIIHQFDDAAAKRLKTFKNVSASSLMNGDVTDEDVIDSSAYIKAYFEHVNPLYPFLNRHEFEELAQRHTVDESLRADAAWSALYHGVLCLGSMYCDGGSFMTAQGTSWRLFVVALRLLPELLLARRTLRTAQALTVMAIYGQTFASLPIDEIPITEAARIALSLSLGRRSRPDVPISDSTRAFWVIYCMEKDFSFNVSRSSLINDHDIGCTLPPRAIDDIQHLDWIRTWATFSRIVSKSYESLFSLSANLVGDEIILDRIDESNTELDNWRDSIPLQLRPGHPIQPHKLGDSVSVTLAVKIHFYYFNMKIALSRLCLRICRGVPSARESYSKKTLLNSARSIIETINFIEMEPFTPGWILLHVPTVAVFILFDFTIHNPSHLETERNLALLNVAVGFFVRANIKVDPMSSVIPVIELIKVANEFVLSSQRKGNCARVAGSSPVPDAATYTAASAKHSTQPFEDLVGSAANSSFPMLSNYTEEAPNTPGDFPTIDQEHWPTIQSMEPLAYPLDLSLFINTNFQSLTPTQSSDVYDITSYIPQDT